MKKILIFFGVLFFFLSAGTGLILFKALTQEPEPKAAEEQPQGIRVTLIEGWTLEDMGQYLEKKHLVPSEVFLKAANGFSADKYKKTSQRPAGSSLEGYVFPDTYRLPAINSQSATSTQFFGEALLDRALKNFESKFSDEMSAKAAAMGLTVHETVILASIVEKETGRNATTPEQKASLAEERKIVAGIFLNRLKIGMALESDATVNYVTGKNLPSPTLEDIRTNSPYNTYVNRGLPPGPISNPSLSSLVAVTEPTKTDFYFFLHKQPSGEPVYSKTHEEHVQNKNKYLK